MIKKFITLTLCTLMAVLTIGFCQGQARAAVANGWEYSGSTWNYYINSTKANGWVWWNGNWYFLDNTGMKTGWVSWESHWYYMDQNGAMKTGWLKDGSKWYYLDNTGKMAASCITYDGYTVDSHGVWDGNEKWKCPQVVSTAIDVPKTDFKTLGKNLGMDYTDTTCIYGVYGYPNLPAFWLTAKNGYYNSEVQMYINTWNGSDSNMPNHKIRPIAKQVFKFYFGDSYMDMYNIVDGLYTYKTYDARYKENLNKVLTIGNRQVYIKNAIGQTQIFISKANGTLQ